MSVPTTQAAALLGTATAATPMNVALSKVQLVTQLKVLGVQIDAARVGGDQVLAASLHAQERKLAAQIDAHS